jgi:hypothetical protein
MRRRLTMRRATTSTRRRRRSTGPAPGGAFAPLVAVAAGALVGIAVTAAPAAARPPAAPDPVQQCRAAIQLAERAHNLPPQLLHAIARVESGRRDPETGTVGPWPWTINAEGQGRFFATREEAIAQVRQLQARGVRLIDVGCMQIDLHHHPHAFASLEEAFDPVANARYAARLMRELHASRGDWTVAAGHYHSSTPERAEGYRARVLAAWPAEQRRPYTIRDEMALAWAQSGAQRRPGLGAALASVATGHAAQQSVAAASQNGFAAAAALSLSNRAERARILPLGGGAGSGGTGRGLDAYRATPIAIAGRQVHVTQLAEAPDRR